MGYGVIRQGDTDSYGVYSYVADTEDDLQKIDLKGALPGSSVIVLSQSEVYMLNTSKEWIKL